jgi:hypothetical protein
MKNRPAIIAIVLLAGLLSGSATSEARHRRRDKTEGKSSLPKYPTVEVSLASMRMDRPPRTSFEVNFVLHNPTAEPLWFLLPLALPLKSGNQISVLEEHRAMAHRTEVTVGRTLGLWAYQMVLLGPQSKAKVQRLPVAFWGELPQNNLAFEVLVVSDLRIGNKPAQQWFTSDPTLKNGVDLKGERLQLSTTKRAAPGQATVVMQKELHVKLNLALTVK